MDNQITNNKTYSLEDAIALLNKLEDAEKQYNELKEEACDNPPDKVDNPHMVSKLAKRVFICLLNVVVYGSASFFIFSGWAVLWGLLFVAIGIGAWAYMYFIPLVNSLKEDEDEYKQYLFDYAEWKKRYDNYQRRLSKASDAIPTVNDMRDVIFDSINRQLLIPFKIEWIRENNYSELASNASHMLALLKDSNEATDAKNRRSLLMKLSDEKTSFLYEYSIEEEADYNGDSYSPFEQKLDSAIGKEDYSLLRKDNEEKKILSGKKTRVEIDVQKCKSLLADNKMEPLIAQLEEVKNTDTSVMGLGLFTSTDKLAEKTETLQQLCNAAKAEYDELTNINEQLNNLLRYTRLVAYRNIFLCTDLVNFVRANAGGKKLTTQKDSVQVEDVKIDDFAANNKDFSMDYGANIGNTIGNIANRLMDNKALRKFAKANPAVAAGTAAIEVAKNLLKERNDTIEKNNRMQAELIKNISQMVDGYNQGKAEMMRAIEIIKAIVNANKGVVKIYAPLRDKYFTSEDLNVPANEVMQDIRTLALATNEYKHISDSKL